MESNSDSSGAHTVSGGSRRRLSLASVHGTFRELMRWWRQELLGMIPSGWQHWSQPALRVEAGQGELRVFSPLQQQPIDRLSIAEEMPGSVAATSAMTHCELVLDSELGLVTPLTLPLAAEANLRNVINFSMDRYTPFHEDDVYYDLRITGRDREHDRLELMLYVVPRATLDAIVRRLAGAGIEVVSADIIDSMQEGVRPAGANLLPAKKGKGAVYQSRLNGALLLSSCVLLLAVVVIPLYQRDQAVRVMESEIEALRKPMQEAEIVRADVNRRSETLRIILQRRNAMPPVLDLLRELTRLTPDEAWAGQVEIKEGRLRLTGEASAGSELLQALTSSDYFADPRFEAPLTQNPKSGRERFVISLAIREQRNAP